MPSVIVLANFEISDNFFPACLYFIAGKVANQPHRKIEIIYYAAEKSRFRDTLFS
jgi:hypothetical protein